MASLQRALLEDASSPTLAGAGARTVRSAWVAASAAASSLSSSSSSLPPPPPPAASPYRIKTVSRLDGPTSGAMLVPLSADGEAYLTGLFKDRGSVSKVYLALVRGNLLSAATKAATAATAATATAASGAGSSVGGGGEMVSAGSLGVGVTPIPAWVGGETAAATGAAPATGVAFRISQRLRMVETATTYRAFVHPRGKEAVTDVQCLGVLATPREAGAGDVVADEEAPRRECFTLCACYPHTGRTHQIRAHLAHLGFSLAGDRRYGKSLRGRRTVGFSRLFLHSAAVSVPLPTRSSGGGGIEDSNTGTPRSDRSDRSDSRFRATARLPSELQNILTEQLRLIEDAGWGRVAAELA